MNAISACGGGRGGESFDDVVRPVKLEAPRAAVPVHVALQPAKPRWKPRAHQRPTPSPAPPSAGVSQPSAHTPPPDPKKPDRKENPYEKL